MTTNNHRFAHQRTRNQQERHEAQAGWCQPFPDARFHYFKRGAVRSLCGSLLYSGAPRDDANDDRALACNACREQVRSLRKAGQP